MRVRDLSSALQFSCPKCDATFGELCLSKAGLHMAHYVHPEREPDILHGQYDAWRLAQWLERNAYIFTEDQ